MSAMKDIDIICQEVLVIARTEPDEALKYTENLEQKAAYNYRLAGGAVALWERRTGHVLGLGTLAVIYQDVLETLEGVTHLDVEVIG